jgi:hypothetical protein
VVEHAQRAYERDGVNVTRFHTTRYQTGTWSRPRRGVIKVEVPGQSINTRFVVTDLEQTGAKVLYQQLNCARPNEKFKGHKRYLKSDRTSCLRFEANQLKSHFRHDSSKGDCANFSLMSVALT